MATINEDKDAFTFDKFYGLRNNVGIESFEPGDCEIALNVDQTDALRLRRRKGFDVTSVTAAVHSLWSTGSAALVVEDTTLNQMLPDKSLHPVRTGLTPDARVYYAAIGPRVFYSNGYETGVFQDGRSRSWGLERPVKLPLVSAIGGSLLGATTGNLLAGIYQYTMTYVRHDGQESGAPGSGNFNLLTTGGLLFSDLPVPTDPDVAFKRLYLSPVNGDQLYLLLNLPNAALEATYVEPRTGTTPMTTQFLSPAPAGRLLGVFAGHVLVARGNTLYRSETYAPELFDFRKGLQFSDRITLVAPMDDGVYLGTESEVVWLAGRDPAKWERQVKSVHGAILGTLAYSPAEDLLEGQSGPAVFFVTTKGIVAGMNGGTLISLTEQRYSFPVMQEGAGVVRHQGGTVQYVVTVRGTEGVSNPAF